MKPKCSPTQMMKVVSLQVPCKITPEHKLVLMIIGSAVADLYDKTYCHIAKSFFINGAFKYYCNLIDLNPDATRELLVQGGYLEDRA